MRFIPVKSTFHRHTVQRVLHPQILTRTVVPDSSSAPRFRPSVLQVLLWPPGRGAFLAGLGTPDVHVSQSQTWPGGGGGALVYGPPHQGQPHRRLRHLRLPGQWQPCLSSKGKGWQLPRRYKSLATGRLLDSFIRYLCQKMDYHSCYHSV